MTHTNILKNIFTYVSNIKNIPKMIYPNVPSGTLPSEYCAIYVIPAATETACIDGVMYYYGLIQIDCVTKDGIGVIRASEIAQTIMSAMKSKTAIATGLIVDRAPYASAGINTVSLGTDGVANTGYYKVPVTIRYRNYDLEA